MVADRAGTSGSCQALRMMMRVASPIDRRIGEGGGQMRHSGFEQADFHSFGLFLPVNWSRKRAGSEYARPFPQLKPKALILKRSRQTTPLHSTLNAGSIPERWLARVLLVRPFAALGWPGSSLSFGSITLSLRHCCRWLQPDILPWLPCKAPPPPGWSVA
jgi:hypothetical protein